jgi:geranylgeranylglycerol-phosphate geranylgeranyltransferase
MAGFAVLIGAKLGGGIFFSEPILLALLAAFLICGAGNTINDYFDYEIDKINKSDRPLPAGKISLKSAFQYSIILFGAGIILSFFINYPAFLLAILNSILLYFYAQNIKRGGGLSKNLIVSYLVASPFLFGGLAVGNPGVTLFLFVIAFFVNTSREVVKDIEDYDGDVNHLKSLPVRYGFKFSGAISSIFILVSIFLSPLPYTLGMVDFIYLPLIGLADLALIYCFAVVLHSPREKARVVQRLIKTAMILALIGFFLGSL